MDIKRHLSWRKIAILSALLALFFLWIFPEIFPVDTDPGSLNYVKGERTWSWYVSIPMAFFSYVSMMISSLKYSEEEEEGQ